MKALILTNVPSDVLLGLLLQQQAKREPVSRLTRQNRYKFAKLKMILAKNLGTKLLKI